MQPTSPVYTPRLTRRPLGLHEVQITGGLWAAFQERNRAATLPHIFAKLEEEGWINNFDLAATGQLPKGRRGREFSDSEVYKFLEALSWEIGRQPSEQLERMYRSVVSRVAGAQQPDGYLNTMFGRPGQSPRWSDLAWGHELYCLGHLFQAAVARERAVPEADDVLLGLAVKAANLVCEVFDDGGIEGVCGHPEVEVGLAELARLTGDPRYLRQAQLFIDRRGHGTLPDIEWGRDYYQDDEPVRNRTIMTGHAVRANYLAAGAVDVAVDSGDETLLGALRVQWKNTTARRTYITGGQGSHHQDEAFGLDWELPPDRAYSETCAGIGSMMFSWRLLQTELDSAYADLIERTLYNVVATSPGDDGITFFYANTLHQRDPGEPITPGKTSPRANSSNRSSWFEVSCCPPNVARTISSLAAYVATLEGNTVEIHQYASATIRTKLASGDEVGLDIMTDYPQSGAVTVRVVRGPARSRWAIALRVPHWVSEAAVSVTRGGRHEQLAAGPGYVTLEHEWKAGDEIQLRMPIAPRLVYPHPSIDSVRGCVAVERGPEVLALEVLATADDCDLDSIRYDSHRGIVTDGDAVLIPITREEPPAPAWPYDTEDAQVTSVEGSSRALVRYREWGNGGPATMRVWIPLARASGEALASLK